MWIAKSSSSNLPFTALVDIYILTGLMPHGEALTHPLLLGHVVIHSWGEVEGHYGPNPYDEGCIHATSIRDIAE